jgi:hypothetical protein
VKRFQTARQRQRARLLLQQDGLCCYCGIRMLLVKITPCMTPPDAACTIEHVYPKGHPLRGTPNSRKLACYRCNQDRGIEHGEAVRQGRGPAVPVFFQPLRWLVSI